MPGPESRPLGSFTATELRVGGIGLRGFVQPMMGGRPTGSNEELEVVRGLVKRGLMLHDDAGWRPIGRYLELLDAAAAARTLVASPPARSIGPSADVWGPERLVLGGLGEGELVLDLRPDRSGYQVRLITIDQAVDELIGWCGMEGGDPGADQQAAVYRGDPEWADLEAGITLDGGVPLRIETASVAGPDGPYRQNRILVTRHDSTPWLLLSAMEGSRLTQSLAPAAPQRARRVLRLALTAEPVLL